MKRSLSLVLNGRNSSTMLLQDVTYLELVTMESKELDEYISKTFNSSDEVRKKYSLIIEPFLEQNRTFLKRVEQENGKKYEGSIVITEFNDDLTIERRKVLYKKDIILFKEIIKNRKFILALENYDYLCSQSAIRNNENYRRIFPEYYGKELRFRCFNVDQFKRIIGKWRTALKESHNYYDYIRTILKEYQNRYKELGLVSLDVVYSTYLSRKKKDSIASLEKELIYLDNLKSEYQEPQRYPSIYDEEGYPGDLEKHYSEGYLDEETNEDYKELSVKMKKKGSKKN